MSQRTLLAAVAAAAADQPPIVEEDALKAVEPDDDEDEDKDKDEDEEEMDTKKIEAAVTAERVRILGIQASAFKGQEAIAAELISSGASVGDAAVAFNADQKAKLASVLKNFDADEEKVKGLRSEYATANPTAEQDANAHLSGEDKWKAEYASDAKLRREFSSEGDYMAFKKADARGAIRILNK